MRVRLLLPLLLVAGCPLAHDDPAPKACLDDDDCFVFEGEYCDRPSMEEEGVCRPRLDVGVPDLGPLPDRGPLPDLPPTESGPGDLGDLGLDATGDAAGDDADPGPDQGGD